MRFTVTEMAFKIRHDNFKSKSKYGNEILVRDGITFKSKAEVRFYEYVNHLQEKGEILFYLMQVPFYLVPKQLYPTEEKKKRYVLDYMIFWANGEVTFPEVKGFKTETYKVKKYLIEANYPITITEIR